MPKYFNLILDDTTHLRIKTEALKKGQSMNEWIIGAIENAFEEELSERSQVGK